MIFHLESMKLMGVLQVTFSRRPGVQGFISVVSGVVTFPVLFVFSRGAGTRWCLSFPDEMVLGKQTQILFY